MSKVIITTALFAFTGYMIYTVYNKFGKVLVDLGDFLPDEGVGNGYVDIEKRMRSKFTIQDGVGSSDFFDIGEGGVTGMRPD